MAYIQQVSTIKLVNQSCSNKHPLNNKNMEPVDDKTKHEEAVKSLIIFFFERILDREGVRRILSLTGTLGREDCTPSMRQLVRGSVTKIKEFLSQYPTLFSFEGDCVKINTSPDCSNNGDAGRIAYTKQAIKYFSEKMAYYVEGTKIPIRVIIGYQSLASPEIQKATDYKRLHICDFLLKHPENFLLTNNNQFAILKNYNDYKPRPTQLRHTSPGNPDSTDIQHLLDFLASHANLKDLPYERLKTRLISWKSSLVNQPVRLFTWRESSNIHHISSVQHCEIVTKGILDTIQKNDTQGDGADWPFALNKVRIAFECEGSYSGRFGHISLMLIATVSEEVYVFDIKSCEQMVEAGLKKILESPNVVKIMHNCVLKSMMLHKHFNITLCNVLDVGSAHEVLTFQNEKVPVHKVHKLPLHLLYTLYKVPIHLNNYQFYNNGHTYEGIWLRRPLDEEAVLLAVAKVSGLVQIYQCMCETILPENRKLLLELCHEQIFLRIKPDRKQRREKNSYTAVALENNGVQGVPEADKDKLTTRSGPDTNSMPNVNKTGGSCSGIKQDNKEILYMDYEIKLPNIPDPVLNEDEMGNDDYIDKPYDTLHSAYLDPFGGNICICSDCHVD